MNDDKVKLDELTVNELSEVKGGLPYEKPDLISLEAGKIICNSGTSCDDGLGGRCDTGTYCHVGEIATPEG